MTKINYSIYLQLDSILNAQILQSADIHDEMLFIITHQTYELWFKQIIHEIGLLNSLLISKDLCGSLHTLKRLRTIIKLLIFQIDVLETMTPRSFAAFRKKLGSASGMQSFQFSEIEFLLGIKNGNTLVSCVISNNIRGKSGNSVWQNFINLCRSVYIGEIDDMKSILNYLYKNHCLFTEIMEWFLDIDEGIQEWRYRHVRMVERIIGHKSGTGGSSGVSYLNKTLTQSFCNELWDIRE